VVQCASTVQLKDRLRRTDLHINYSQVMPKAVMYLTRQAIALFRRCQFLDLRRVIPQQLVSFRESGAGLALARCHTREDNNKDNTGAIYERDGNSVNPSAADH
jgi:hypothetical protein